MSAEEQIRVDMPIEEPQSAIEPEEAPRLDRAAQRERDRRKALLITLAVVIVVTIVFIWVVYFPGPNRSEWAYKMTQLNAANDMGYTGEGVRVAVVDTGINADHEVFKGVDIVLWKDFVNGRSKPYDDQGHGTAMASIIAGQSKLRGGAPDVQLIIVKVLNKDGVSSDSRVAEGIEYCIDPNNDGDHSDGADVISLSLGGRTSYLGVIIGTESQAAIHRAADLGVFVVAAAGNDGGPDDDGDVASPGWFRDVICVGAVDEDGRIADFSSTGRNILKQDPNRKPEVVAPGVDIVSADHEGGYKYGSGTSQATAFMAACIAVTLEAHPELAREGRLGGNEDVIYVVKAGIFNTSKKMSGQKTPHDNKYGYGLVQTVDLINELEKAVA